MRRRMPPSEEPVSGLTVFTGAAVEDVPHSQLADDLLAHAIKALERKGPYKPGPSPYKQVDLYELMLSQEVRPKDAVLWLGKAQQAYGGDFASLDLGKTAAANHTTDEAAQRINRLADDGSLRFVFIIESEAQTDAQYWRANLLKEALGKLALPAMALKPSILPPAELGEAEVPPQEISPEEVIFRYFTIDDSLTYPLILRQKPMPKGPPPSEQLTLTD